jgi:hypothetical protein
MTTANLEFIHNMHAHLAACNTSTESSIDTVKWTRALVGLKIFRFKLLAVSLFEFSGLNSLSSLHSPKIVVNIGQGSPHTDNYPTVSRARI